MREEESTTLQEQENQDSAQKKPMSALDAINASFAAQKEEMDSGKKKSKAKEPKREPDRAKETVVKKTGKNEELKWNLITAFLVLVIVVVAVVIVATLYMGSRADNPSAVGMTEQTVGSTSAAGNENTEETSGETQENAETQSETQESQSEQPEEESQTSSEQSESAQTESQEESAQSETQGIVPEEYTSILTEEEQQEWREKEKDPSRVFIQLNQRIEITDMQNVYLRLINPPYSAFTIQVRVYPEDNAEQILYESDRVAPGTVLEYVSFSGELEAGSHPAKVEYTVYDEDGNELGIHEVDITLEVSA